MKTLELKLPTPVLLVWGLPEDAENPFISPYEDGILGYWRYNGQLAVKAKIPKGNWQPIGKLSELTDFNTRKAIKDKGYHIMNPYMMPNSRNYSARQLENDNSDYWKKYDKWQEAQSKTLPANTLIFKVSMKTAEEYLNSKGFYNTNRLNNCFGEEITITDMLREYATEAIKADRENIKTDLFFEGDMNKRRIKSYRDLAKDYNVSESTIRDIFSLGINFAAANFKNLPIELK